MCLCIYFYIISRKSNIYSATILAFSSIHFIQKTFLRGGQIKCPTGHGVAIRFAFSECSRHACEGRNTLSAGAKVSSKLQTCCSALLDQVRDLIGYRRFDVSFSKPEASIPSIPKHNHQLKLILLSSVANGSSLETR